MRMVFKKTNLCFLVSIMVYRIVLDYTFVAITEIYPYWYHCDNVSVEMHLLSWIVLLFFNIPLLKYFNGNQSLSDAIMIILYFFSIIPFTSQIKYGQFTIGFVTLNIIFWVTLIMFHVLLKKNRSHIISIRIGKYFFAEKTVKYLVCIISLCIIYIWAEYAGFRVNFSIQDSLAIRNEAATYTLPGILEYIYLWSQVLIPVLLIYFLVKKDKIFMVICLITQLISYCINGMKLTLFLTVVIIGISLFSKMTLKTMDFLLSIGLSLICILGILEKDLLGTHLLTGVIIMRMIFMPNAISYFYYDFFKTNAPDYYRASFLSHFGFETPYDNLPNTIGLTYFNSDMSCNNGLISEGIANLGLVGIFVIPFAIALFFKILDEFSYNISSKVYMGIAFVIGLRLISSYLVTNLLSYGMIIMIILLGFLSKSEIIIRKSSTIKMKSV